MTRLPPPEVVLGWPRPNYVDPEQRGPAGIIVELIFLPLALICLGLRLYVRLAIVRKTGWDDWLMVAAAIFATSVTICVILATKMYGWNLHVWDLTPDQIVDGRKISISGQMLFLFASGLAKLSILSSYLRIAPAGSWFRRLTWAAIGLVAALIGIFLVVLWTQCSDMSYYWRLSPLSADVCIGEWPPLAGQTLTTVATDFIVSVLPMPTLWRLRLPVFQRVVLMVLFGLGLVVVVASAMRTYWVWHVTTQTFDVTWEGFQLWIWTAVEVNLGIICGCVPVLRRLLPARLSGSNHYGGAQRTPGSARVPPQTIGSSKQRRPGGAASRADVEEDGYDDEYGAHALGSLPKQPAAIVKSSPPGWLPIQDSWDADYTRRGPEKHTV